MNLGDDERSGRQEPTDSTFRLEQFSSTSGVRDYRLYIPSSCGDATASRPLIIMLHGCKQDATDFALSTGMNLLAEEQGCLVAYPIQPSHASHTNCWNWFKPSHQQRGRGEPALIAGITRAIIERFDVDVGRVYIAGLSAGGAMAAVMINTYPELFAAAGIHSGLPYRGAWGLFSALAAMRIGTVAPHGPSGTDAWIPQRPLIVFHGDSDATVHPSNGWALLRGFEGVSTTTSERYANHANGRSSTQRTLVSSTGVDAEHWMIHGAPHAWAGGNEDGSYVDAPGPNASAEMLRFFLAHANGPSFEQR